LLSALTSWGWPPRAQLYLVLYPLAVAGFTLCFFHYRRLQRDRHEFIAQVERFRVAEAKCFDENDRRLVTQMIGHIYGSEAAFECEVRRHLLTQARGGVNRSFDLTYVRLVRMACPLFCCFALDDVAVALESAPWWTYRFNYVVGEGCLCFVLLPVFQVVLRGAASYCLHRPKTVLQEFAVCFSFAVVVSLVGCALIVVLQPWLNCPDERQNIIAYAICAVLFLLTFGRMDRIGRSDLQRTRSQPCLRCDSVHGEWSSSTEGSDADSMVSNSSLGAHSDFNADYADELLGSSPA